MEIKLFDSELKIMELLWKEDDISAKQLAEVLSIQVGWSKTTTYTVIKKCVEKGVITRTEPGFICHANMTREQAQQLETKELINKMYSGSVDQLIASLLGTKRLSSDEINKLRNIVKEMD